MSSKEGEIEEEGKCDKWKGGWFSCEGVRRNKGTEWEECVRSDIRTQRTGD